ncbi:MAG TPA: class II aldolase/adducin family protein, partial [Stellaceae bacterium]|nr:class II aldolase/adducin family protein [Stellaceae bacterium]
AESQLKIQAAVAAGGKMVVPSAETCERQAAQFVGNNPRLQGQREWPALLRMLDRIEPGYRS